jgi:hypothetical protein
MGCVNLPKTLVQVLTEAVYQDESGNYFLNLAPISVDCEAIVPLVNCNNPDPNAAEIIAGTDECGNNAIKVGIRNDFLVPYTGAIDDLDLGEFDLFADYVESESAVFGTSTNKVTIDETGILLEGDATVWDDIRIVPNIFDVPGNTDPDIISYRPTGSGATFKVYAFAKGDEGFFTIQFPHDYKVGSNLRAHVHWTPGPRGNEESGKIVQWRLDYTITSIGQNFIASQTVPLPGTCSGVDNKHEMTAEVDISGAGLGISSQMFGRIYRFNDASDNWVGTGADLPIFIEFDLHYEKDTLGSRTPTSK